MSTPSNTPRYAPRPEGEPTIIVDAIPLEPVGDRFRVGADNGQGRPPGVGHPAIAKTLDRVLSVQRPIVLGHIRRLRARHPEASPAAIISLLEKHYLTTVMAGGAGVGATAAVPGVGTVAALAISSAETIGFVEATTLFGHAVAEMHGLVLSDRDRAHALILSLMLGEEGASLLRQITGQVAGGTVKNAFWGEIITRSMPKNLVSPAVDQLRKLFLKQLAKKGTASVIGKVIPYGVGAVIGGAGNRVLGGRIVKNARRTFGPAPLTFPEFLAEIPTKLPRKVRKLEKAELKAERRLEKAERKALTQGTPAPGGE
ncbi:MAG: hypothetical protein ACTIJ6_03820 [Leucobacter sp.]